MEKKYAVNHESDLAEVVSVLREVLLSRQGSQVVYIRGPMGSGKTTFVRHWLKELSEDLNFLGSPTFALSHSYQTRRGRVEHWDLYRLKHNSEIEATGFYEILAERRFWILFVEWPERLLPSATGELSSLLTQNDVSVEIEVGGLATSELGSRVFKISSQ